MRCLESYCMHLVLRVKVENFKDEPINLLVDQWKILKAMELH